MVPELLRFDRNGRHRHNQTERRWRTFLDKLSDVKSYQIYRVGCTDQSYVESTPALVWDVIENESDKGEKNDMATALLFQYIPETLILHVGELDTAKKVWVAIKSKHMGADRVREAILQILMAEFNRLKMKDSDIIDDFVGKLSKISSKSPALGE